MRAAASLILARDGDAGLEVLLVERGAAGDFPGLHVFPGGLVDAADAEPVLTAASLRDAASADALLGTSPALPYFLAAVREALEETGILLTPDPHTADLRRTWQSALLTHEQRFADLLAQQVLRLATDGLGYFSHWITPAGIPRRYDTRFLVARMPAQQAVNIDGREAVRADWLTPANALAAHARHDIRLIFPTIRNLEALLAFDCVDALLAHTHQSREVVAMLPKMVNGADGVRLLLPGEPGYDAA